jgi:phenylacetate-CoA ligase
LDFLKKTKVKDYLYLYTKTLYWSKDEIENYRVNKIYELLEYAYNNVSFYNKRFKDSGFSFDKFRYLDQLTLLPVLTRKDIQENLIGLVSKEFDLKKCRKGSSSGSTGRPVTYYHDLNDYSASKAAGLFLKILGGYQIGDSWLNLWGNQTAVNVDWKKMSSKISKLLFNEIRFPAYKLKDKKEFNNLTNMITEKRPKFIYGYTNAIYLLAEYIKSIGANLNFIKGVFTTAENLHSYQRKLIEENLGKVFDQYGSSEINGIAAETIYGDGYYILAPRVYVEFGETFNQINNSKALIITSFDNKVLPFIRYENGDHAVPCENTNYYSGINYPRLKSIEGRVSDIIKLPNGGSLVVPSFFGSRMLKNISGITQYQIVKKSYNKIEINLITNNYFKDEFKEIILNTLKEYIPSELQYNLLFNQPIILSSNNKFKLLIDLTEQKNQ